MKADAARTMASCGEVLGGYDGSNSRSDAKKIALIKVRATRQNDQSDLYQSDCTCSGGNIFLCRLKRISNILSK